MLQNETKTVIHKRPSPIPFYILAAIWLAGTFFLKMYKWSSWLILALICLATWLLIKALKLFPDTEVAEQVEIPRSYSSQVQQQSLQDGTATLKNILKLNDSIANPQLQANIKAMASTTDKILDYLYQHEAASQPLRKLIYYYLPTIEKLQTKYIDLQDQPGSENVTSAKAKIEDIVKTTATAFENQLNSLYDSEHLDVSAETKVLEKLYEQEGLIDEKQAQS